jgi:hypothetical protein
MTKSKLYNLFATPTAAIPFAPGQEIHNDHEPLSSNDMPSPANANFFRGDDHVYYHINGTWKRTPIVNFSPSNI